MIFLININNLLGDNFMKKLTIFATTLAIISVLTTNVFANSNDKAKVRKTTEESTTERSVDHNNNASANTNNSGNKSGANTDGSNTNKY